MLKFLNKTYYRILIFLFTVFSIGAYLALFNLNMGAYFFPSFTMLFYSLISLIYITIFKKDFKNMKIKSFYQIKFINKNILVIFFYGLIFLLNGYIFFILSIIHVNLFFFYKIKKVSININFFLTVLFWNSVLLILLFYFDFS